MKLIELKEESPKLDAYRKLLRRVMLDLTQQFEGTWDHWNKGMYRLRSPDGQIKLIATIVGIKPEEYRVQVSVEYPKSDNVSWNKLYSLFKEGKYKDMYDGANKDDALTSGNMTYTVWLKADGN